MIGQSISPDEFIIDRKRPSFQQIEEEIWRYALMPNLFNICFFITCQNMHPDTLRKTAALCIVMRSCRKIPDRQTGADHRQKQYDLFFIRTGVLKPVQIPFIPGCLLHRLLPYFLRASGRKLFCIVLQICFNIRVCDSSQSLPSSSFRSFLSPR